MNTNESTQTQTKGWENQDTRKLFHAIYDDSDVLLFTIREFGQFENHFTDECEEALKKFFETMLYRKVITYRIDLERVSWSQLTARFLECYHTQVEDYQTWKKDTRFITGSGGFGAFHRDGKRYNIETEQWEDEDPDDEDID